MNFTNSPVFVPNFGDLGYLTGEIKYAPQFYRADLDFIWKKANELGNLLMMELAIAIDNSKLLADFKYISVDTRVHMLMPEMYPCIPGWHCDDFYRPDGAQPDLQNVLPAKHLALVLDAGSGSFTEYLTEAADLPAPEELVTIDPDPIYGKYNAIIEEAVSLKRKTVKSGELAVFGPLDFHRGMPATGRGWRFFMRATGSDHREPKSELRTQTQVYLTKPFHGW